MTRTKFLMLACVCSSVCLPGSIYSQGVGQGEVRGLQPAYQPYPQVQSRAFVAGDIGGEWTLDTHVKNFFDDPLAPGAKVKFDPGVRFGFSGGYFVTDFMAIGGETGVMANWIDSVSGPSIVHDVYFSNVPFLATLRFQCPSRCSFIPYFGGGVGGSATVLDADQLTIGLTTMHGSDATVVFAYEAFGGFRFRISPEMSLGVEYRYFATGDPEWEAEDFFGGHNHMSFAGVQTHNVSFTFEYNF